MGNAAASLHCDGGEAGSVRKEERNKFLGKAATTGSQQLAAQQHHGHAEPRHTLPREQRLQQRCSRRGCGHAHGGWRW